MGHKNKKKSILVFTDKSCEGCAELKRQAPNLKYLELTKNKKAQKLADRLGIKYVPTAITIDEETGKICVLDNNLKPIKCINKKGED